MALTPRAAAASSLRYTTATGAPVAASRAAIRDPIPREAPVTTAGTPLSGRSVVISRSDLQPSPGAWANSLTLSRSPPSLTTLSLSAIVCTNEPGREPMIVAESEGTALDAVAVHDPETPVVPAGPERPPPPPPPPVTVVPPPPPPDPSPSPPSTPFA